MAHRNLRLIDMGDGTWAVCCMACRRALFRGPTPVADRVFASHRCEPVLPLSRPRRGAPVGLVRSSPQALDGRRQTEPPWTTATAANHHSS
jgi:hypothetical protein